MCWEFYGTYLPLRPNVNLARQSIMFYFTTQHMQRWDTKDCGRCCRLGIYALWEEGKGRRKANKERAREIKVRGGKFRKRETNRESKDKHSSSCRGASNPCGWTLTRVNVFTVDSVLKHSGNGDAFCSVQLCFPLTRIWDSSSSNCLHLLPLNYPL